MTDFAQVLFENGQATPLLLARWRSKQPLKPLPADLTLTLDGIATPDFRTLWALAFPDRPPLPFDQVHDTRGHLTIGFHRVFR